MSVSSSGESVFAEQADTFRRLPPDSLHLPRCGTDSCCRSHFLKTDLTQHLIRHFSYLMGMTLAPALSMYLT